MRVDDLVAYDLVPSELAALRALIPERLLPLQALALQRGLLAGGRDLLIAAGPGAGKSTLGELAVLHAGHVGQRALLLNPQSAELRQLVIRPQELDALDLLVVDGGGGAGEGLIHGPLFELLLRHLGARRRRLRLIVLCDLVDGAAGLAERLGAELVVGETGAGRLGVLSSGRALFRAGHGRVEEDLGLPLRGGASLLGTLVELARRGQQTVVVWPDAARCVRMAERLAASLGRWGSAAVQALGELAGTAPGRAQSVLAETLRRGVAIYTPELSPRQRRLVERAVVSGEVRLLCTSELALPALAPAGLANVVVSTSWRWQREREGGRWQRTDLESRDVAQLAAGFPQARTLLYARSRGEAELMWRRHIESETTSPVPLRRSGAELGEAVACLLASGAVASEAAAAEWLGGDGVGQEVAELRSAGLVAKTGVGLTPLGQAAAECGLPGRTAHIWGRWVESSRLAGNPTALEVLCVAALGPGTLPLPLLISEQPLIDYGARLLERAEVMAIAERPLFRWLRKPANQLSHETLRAMKRALLLHDWIEGVAGQTLESTYHLWVGAVGRLAADCAGRVEALERVCLGLGWAASVAGQRGGLGELARRLRARPVDSVAEHQEAPPAIGRAIGGVLGALHAQRSNGKAADSAEVIPIGKVRSA